MHEGNHDHCCGAHDHDCGCAHTHEHTHTHTHEHTHDAAHGHTHEGGCCGGNAEQAGGNETLAMLDYMLKHNQHHALELEGLKTQLDAMGKAEAAGQLDAVIDDYNKGNVRLAAIVASLKE